MATATKAYYQQSVEELEQLCLDLAGMAGHAGVTQITAGMGQPAGTLVTPYQFKGAFLLKILAAMETAAPK